MAIPTTKEALAADAVLAEYNKAYPAPKIIDVADNTDVGNARRLVALFGDRIRYCHPWKSWLCWNGKFWERDNSGQIFRYAKETANAMLAEAETLGGDLRDRLHKHAVNSKSLTKLKAMVTLAESEEGVTILPEQLDKNIWLMNVQNGTLDLTTGRLREHLREDFITKMSPVVCDSSAAYERWGTVLQQIFEGKKDLIDYVQKVMGQMLTGDASEEQLFVFWGTGANGKSTIIETIAYILGDYSKTIGIESLMKKERGSISNDIARLKGARFVYANEPEFGDHISEGKVKNLTGKDTIQARFLFQENFEFKPEYKLVISTNHKPIIKGMDHGIWRRIKLVPFNVTIPTEQQDKTLDMKLRGEASGILNWLIEGCIAWRKNGIVVPQEVLDATSDYQQEMDGLAEFISDCCDIGNPDYFVSHREIFIIYCGWCKSNLVRTMTKKTFSAKMVEKGFTKDKNEKDIRGFYGLKSTDYLKSVYLSIDSGELPLDYFDRLNYESVRVSRGIITQDHLNNLSNLSKTQNNDSGIPRQIGIIPNIESVESVESVDINTLCISIQEKTLNILKKEYGKTPKPYNIIHLEKLKEQMEVFIMEKTEYDERENIQRVITDFCKSMGW